MKLANVAGRACIVTPTGGVDLFVASDGRFAATVDAAIGSVHEIGEWFTATQPDLDPTLSTEALLADLSRLGPPINRPPQIFAIGLNYADHAEETGLELPSQPMVFTKFASSLAGPGAEVPVLADTIDWEVELVAVVGTGGRDIAAADAWSHIAGFCIGQDISERRLQMASAPAQFSGPGRSCDFVPSWRRSPAVVADNQPDLRCAQLGRVSLCPRRTLDRRSDLHGNA